MHRYLFTDVLGNFISLMRFNFDYEAERHREGLENTMNVPVSLWVDPDPLEPLERHWT